MALLLLAQRSHVRRRRRPPQERVFRARTQFLNLPEEVVMQRYRLHPSLIRDLCHILEHDLQPSTGRSHALPVYVKVTAALDFYTSGTFQTPAGDAAGISQASMSRCVTQVTEAIVRRAHRFIRFPQSHGQHRSISRDFLRLHGFPGAVGVVGCTHVALKPPSDHESRYRNRWRYHSMHMQGVCDARGILTHIVAEYPGSVSEEDILGQSSLGHMFQNQDNEEEKAWLIGGRCYTQKPWLMTPIEDPQSPAEVQYNTSHAAALSVISRAFCSLKSRFRCLSRRGGSLQYSPLKVSQIFVACCVLHNMALSRGLEVPVEEREDGSEEEAVEEISKEAEQARQELLLRHFS
ncbi:putative nuclease HARBI1 [Bombina bombina]|uniref:putative nuclease HARBI1 n=1 Tax=Bombina bombina TaxID=8345 RepID=UPI00235A9483|nr:putative nuclease HARBI1 [Bombina bombina]